MLLRLKLFQAFSLLHLCFLLRGLRKRTELKITPSIPVGSFLENPYITSIAGMRIFDTDAKRVSAVFDKVTGSAVLRRGENSFLMEKGLIPFVDLL